MNSDRTMIAPSVFVIVSLPAPAVTLPIIEEKKPAFVSVLLPLPMLMLPVMFELVPAPLLPLPPSCPRGPDRGMRGRGRKQE